MAGPSDPDEAAVLQAFLQRYLAERDRGTEKELAEYQASFPGFEEIVAREHASLQSGAPGAGDSVRTVYDQLAHELGANPDPGVQLDAERPETPDDPGRRYRALGELARGGMGSIIRAWDRDLRRTLAMKVLRSRADTGQSQPGFASVARFLEEAQITGQLDHPGIVPVHDLGLDADGRVYFTMSLIRGRNFQEIIELVHAGEEAWTLTRALGVVLRVCESVAFAHSKGVVHRDLKPQNVMVGRFGEVYVMDWGLARVIGRADRKDVRIDPARPSPAVRSLRRDLCESESPLLTMDGDVVGTPAYMAPEQARGDIERVGLRSDVFSIGAMLYHLLAGRMPYADDGGNASSREVLGRVLAGAPTPLHAPVPAELIAICERAMAREPEDRYPDVQALGGDLQAFLDVRVVRAYETGAAAELRKWIQRNKPLAAACAAAVLALAAGLLFSLVQMGRADAQATRADANFRMAFDAVDQMLTEVGAARLDDVPQMKAVQRELLQKALDFHLSFLAVGGDDPALREQVADAYRRVGDIQWKLGALAESEAALSKQIELLLELVREHPDRPELRRRLAGARNALAVTHQARARQTEAEVGFRQALAELQAIAPETATADPLKAQILNNLGALLSGIGRPDDALRCMTEAATLRQELVDRDPDRLDLRWRLASQLSNISQILAQLGRSVEAEERLTTAVSLCEDGLQLESRSRDLRDVLASACLNLGPLQRQRGDRAGAERTERRAVALLDALVADFPRVPEYQSMLGAVWSNLSTTLLAGGALAEVHDAIQRAIRHQQLALDVVPDRSVYLGRMRNHYYKLCHVLVRQKNHRELLDAAEAIVAMQPEALELYQRASRFLASAIPMVEADASLPAEERRALAERCGRRAVEHLREAVRRGLRHVGALASTWYDPIRDRSDFQQVSAELEQVARERRDDRDCEDSVDALWVTGQSTDRVSSLTQQNWRITDLEVESTSPMRWAAALVANQGVYDKTFWWKLDDDLSRLLQFALDTEARIVDLEAWRTDEGTRFAAVMVSNEDAARRPWWLYGEETPAAILALAQRHGARFVSRTLYPGDSGQLCAAVMVGNREADERDWLCIENATPEQLDEKVRGGWRPYEIGRAAPGGGLHAILVKAPEVRSWHAIGVSEDRVRELLSARRARVSSFTTYLRSGDRRYDVVMVANERR